MINYCTSYKFLYDVDYPCLNLTTARAMIASFPTKMPGPRNFKSSFYLYVESLYQNPQENKHSIHVSLELCIPVVCDI